MNKNQELSNNIKDATFELFKSVEDLKDNVEYLMDAVQELHDYEEKTPQERKDDEQIAKLDAILTNQKARKLLNEKVGKDLADYKKETKKRKVNITFGAELAIYAMGGLAVGYIVGSILVEHIMTTSIYFCGNSY